MGSRSVSVLTLALAALVTATGARAQTADCEPAWMPLAGYEHKPAGAIYALMARGDVPGAEEQLIAAGSFQTLIGGAPARGIAAWDGASWSELGGGVNGTVYALAVFDDGQGGGPALYAAGSFSSAGGVPCSNLAKWNGASWTDVGGGVNGTAGTFSTFVWCLRVFDDGAGPALYAGGGFGQAGGVPCANIARWDGLGWSALGSGADSSVYALASFDDGLGGGPALHAGGAFATMGGAACSRVARWDGASWSALGPGVGSGPPGGFDDQVFALAVHDDGEGGGPALYVGGDLLAAGGGPLSHVVRWDGLSWEPVGTDIFGGGVFGLAEFDDGSDDGPLLFAAGEFGSGGGGDGNLIARWDGVAWSELDGSLSKWKDEWVQALAIYDDGSGCGRALFIGGSPYLVKWIRCSPPMEPWTDLGSGLPGPFHEPRLTGIGTLQPGSIGWLVLKEVQVDSVGFADVFLFVSDSSTPTAFKGGTLLPLPPRWILPSYAHGLAGSGSTSNIWQDWPPGLPSGTTLYFQFVCEDIYAPNGIALSNAVRAITP